jgi:hypothetical protein
MIGVFLSFTLSQAGITSGTLPHPRTPRVHSGAVTKAELMAASMSRTL